MRCVATFHTHLAALMTYRALQQGGVMAEMAPVPRRLSSSCGTCVYYTAPDAHLADMDADVEAVYEIGADESYRRLLENK
jgi:hypothetical protein